MNILFKIGNLTIEWKDFITFFIGVFFGFVILLLIYLYAVIKSLNKELKINKVKEEDIDEEEIKWLIDDAINTFKDKKIREEIGYGNLLMRELKELTFDISKKFYPDSPYPYLELTIDESIALMHYITDRIDQLLSGKILRLFRGMTIRKLVEMNDTRVKIEESRLVKKAKKHNLSKVVTSTLTALNAVNPFYWFRKITVDKAINAILVRIGISIIAITGEETYKIYSKKVFDKDVELETNVNDLYEQLKRDIEDLGKEDNDEWK